MNPHNLLVFTDMDGSLLDHHSYSHAAADAMLAGLEQQKIPVIANTSKTRAELEVLRDELNNSHPFIAENGAAVYLPKKRFPQQPTDTTSYGNYWVKPFAKPRSHWQALIADIAPKFEGMFVTFAQAGIKGIAEMTGLDRDKAQLAADREYGEPVKWLGDAEQKTVFFAELEARGAHILHGGRFSHISDHCDKGKALGWLKSQYEQLRSQESSFISVALGDSQNDVAMLDAADYAIIIKSPEHQAPVLLNHKVKLANHTLFVTQSYGPEGWVEGINHVFDRLNIEQH